MGTLRQFCQRKRLTNVWFFGIGAVDEVELNVYETTKKGYRKRVFKQQLELVSVNGNVSADGTLHAHGAFADRSYQTFGGHIKRAVVSVTGELVLIPLPGKLERAYDRQTDLNLLNL